MRREHPTPLPGSVRWGRGLLAVLVLLALVATGCGKEKRTQAAVTSIPDQASATGSAGGIEVRQAYISAPTGGGVYQPGSSLVVWLQMVNRGPSWDSLLRGTSSISPRIAVGYQNVPQDFVGVPNDDEPLEGTLGVTDISRPLTPGQDVPVTLQFQEAGPLTLQVPVRRAAPGTAIKTG